MTQARDARCAAHPAERAGWTCQACASALCPQCCVRRRAGVGSLVCCRRCGGHAQPILVPRARRSYASLLPEAFVFPFSTRGLLTIAAMGLVLGLLRLGGWIGFLLSVGSFCSYLFVIVRTSALGEEDMPESEDFSHVWDLFSTLLKATVAFFLALVPLLLYLWKFKGPPPLGATPAQLVRYVVADPFIYLSLALGLAWAPMAVLLAAVNSDYSAIVNPVLAFRSIRRMGGDFALAAVAFWGIAAASLFMSSVAVAFRDLVPVPLLPRMIGEAFSSYFPIVGARMLGQLLFVRGEDIGYGRARDYYDPVLGDVQPPWEEAPPPEQPVQADAAAHVSPELEASLKHVDPSAPRAPVVPIELAEHSFDLPELLANPAPSAEPVLLEGVLVEEPASAELDPSSAPTILELPSPAAAPASEDLMPEADFLAQAHVVAKPAAPVIAAPPPAAAQPPSRPPAAQKAPPTDAQVQALVAAGRFDVVAAAYRARLGDITFLTAEQLLRTADEALARRDLQTASHALKRAGYDHPTSALAPTALLRAARLLAVEMQKPADGAKVARHLVQRHPGSSEAQQAQALLQGGA